VALSTIATTANPARSCDTFLYARSIDGFAISPAPLLASSLFLPGLSGVELHRRLLDDGFAAPTIFVSGLADDATNGEQYPRAVASKQGRPRARPGAEIPWHQ
jgi:hypothetical protein